MLELPVLALVTAPDISHISPAPTRAQVRYCTGRRLRHFAIAFEWPHAFEITMGLHTLERDDLPPGRAHWPRPPHDGRACRALARTLGEAIAEALV